MIVVVVVIVAVVVGPVYDLLSRQVWRCDAAIFCSLFSIKRQSSNFIVSNIALFSLFEWHKKKLCVKSLLIVKFQMTEAQLRQKKRLYAYDLNMGKNGVCVSEREKKRDF